MIFNNQIQFNTLFQCSIKNSQSNFTHIVTYHVFLFIFELISYSELWWFYFFQLFIFKKEFRITLNHLFIYHAKILVEMNKNFIEAYIIKDSWHEGELSNYIKTPPNYCTLKDIKTIYINFTPSSCTVYFFSIP